MRPFILFALALTAGASAVQAQDASQWSGVYGAATYSRGTGFQEYAPDNTYDLEGNGPGLVLGYNQASGPWVFGGELSYSKVDLGELPPGDDYTFSSFLDLKARAGYAVGNALIYGALGATFTQWQEGEGNGGFDGSGVLYGLGVDYLVSPQVFIGAEYLRRNVTSDWNTTGDTFDADANTLSLRVGMKF
ncbi:MAG: outer membrane protein [Tabrizicola sp.]